MGERTSKLAAGLHNGDPDLLDQLIEEYQHRLFRYLLSLTRERSAAEDLFQETWLRVVERGKQYNARWKFEVWLFGIARHLAIDLARRKKSSSLDELMNPEEGEPFEAAAAVRSPFDEIRDSEQRERIGGVLTAIPAGFREVLTLRFQEDLELEEIATIVGSPLSTVKSRLYRGLESLRRLLEREQI